MNEEPLNNDAENLKLVTKAKTIAWFNQEGQPKQNIIMDIIGEPIQAEEKAEIPEIQKIPSEPVEDNSEANLSVFNPDNISSLERKGFEPSPTVEKAKTTIYETPEKTEFEPEIKSESEPVLTPEPVPEVKSEQIREPIFEKMFDDPSVLLHEVKEGDSLWTILMEISGNSKQFKDITEAQKIFVLNKISGMIFDEPEVYGLNKDGSLEIGKKIDLSKILNDTERIESIIKESKETITVGSLKEKSTLKLVEQTRKSEPEIKPALEPIQEIKPEPKPMPEPVIITPETKARETQKVEMMSLLEREKREQIQKEIAEAKQRLNNLEGDKKNSSLERSFTSDSEFNQNIENAFKNEINNIYGKSGLLGMGKTEGINTKEWAEMARLPAAKVIEYYTGDSTRSGLSPEMIKELIKSKNHEALMKQTAGLMEQSNGAVKPFANENMEQFIKRLGGYVLKTHLQK